MKLGSAGATLFTTGLIGGTGRAIFFGFVLSGAGSGSGEDWIIWMSDIVIFLSTTQERMNEEEVQIHLFRIAFFGYNSSTEG